MTDTFSPKCSKHSSLRNSFFLLFMAVLLLNGARKSNCAKELSAVSEVDEEEVNYEDEPQQNVDSRDCFTHISTRNLFS